MIEDGWPPFAARLDTTPRCRLRRLEPGAASEAPIGTAGWRDRGSCSTMRAGVQVNSTAPASASRPWWRRLVRPTLVLAALAIVFGWLLPQVIDYQQVWDAVTSLDGWEVVVLVGLGLARIPTEALMYRAFLPGLDLSRGSAAYLSSNLAGQMLPPPAHSVIQYSYFLGGGYVPDAAGLAALGSFVFPTIGRFLLPVLALLLLLITGEINATIVLAGALRWQSRSSRASPATTSCAQGAPRAGSAPSSSDRSRGSSSSSSAAPSPTAPGGRHNSVPIRSPSCAKAGRWGQSGSRPTCS